jgi:hypothetical protein
MFWQISQPSLDISPIWSPVRAEEISKLQLQPVQAILIIVFLSAGAILKMYDFSEDFGSDSI